MSMSNAFENALAKLIFQAITIDGLAEDDTTSPLTELFIALHTADPGEGGSQTTSEAAYTSYARVAVDRDAGGWDVTGNVASPAAAIDFPQCTAGVGLVETITHASIGTASSGAGSVIVSGPVTPNIPVFNGTTPSLPTTSTITFD